MHSLSNPFALPFAEITIDRGVRWKVMGQHFPLTPTTQIPSAPVSAIAAFPILSHSSHSDRVGGGD